jgi:hypothetical protein
VQENDAANSGLDQESSRQGSSTMTDERPIKEVSSETLKAKLSWIGERYDGKYAHDPVFRFEIALDGRPEPLVAEAVVSDFTAVAANRAADKAGIKKHFGPENSEFRRQYIRSNGRWNYCEELNLPWRNLLASEIIQIRKTFAQLYFDLRCLWSDERARLAGSSSPPKDGKYRLTTLYFAPMGLLREFHAEITTREAVQ